MNDIQKFIQKAQIKFKDLFEYSNILDKSNLEEKLVLKCNKHSLEFTIKPNLHLNSKLGGCPQCLKDFKLETGEKFKLSIQDFIEKANRVHENKYDYSKFVYTLSRYKSTVTCNTHGDFEISPNNHLKGKGCPICGKIRRGISKSKIAADNFIEKANIMHNNTYTYEKFQYKKAKIKAYVTCSDHGEFLCSPDNHLRGKGCPICAKNSSKFINLETFKHFCNKNSKGVGILYMLEVIDLRTNQKFFKVGITSKSIAKRYPKSVYNNYEYKEIFSIMSDAEDIFKTEKLIHSTWNKFKEKVNKDFAGYSECYVENPILIDRFKTLCSDIPISL